MESLALCTRLLESARDPALEILAATNLFSWENSEDARSISGIFARHFCLLVDSS